jgi:hypothetical protein
MWVIAFHVHQTIKNRACLTVPPECCRGRLVAASRLTGYGTEERSSASMLFCSALPRRNYIGASASFPLSVSSPQR